MNVHCSRILGSHCPKSIGVPCLSLHQRMRELLWWINIHACTVLLLLFYFYVTWDEMKAATSLWERQALAYWAARSSGAYDICYSKIDYTAHIEYGIEYRSQRGQPTAASRRVALVCAMLGDKWPQVGGQRCFVPWQHAAIIFLREKRNWTWGENREKGRRDHRFFFLFDGRPFLCLLLYMLLPIRCAGLSPVSPFYSHHWASSLMPFCLWSPIVLPFPTVSLPWA